VKLDGSVVLLVLSTALGAAMSADGRVGKIVQRIGLISQELTTWFMQELVGIEAADGPCNDVNSRRLLLVSIGQTDAMQCKDHRRTS
jgi:hypothetical protein